MSSLVSDTTRHQFERDVLSRLRAMGWRLRGYVATDGLAFVIPAILVWVLLTLGIDRTFRLSWDMRLVQLLSTLAGLCFMIWRWILQPVTRSFDETDLAVLVERRHPWLQSRLISAVEFLKADRVGSSDQRHRCPVLVNALVNLANEDAGRIRFNDILNHSRTRHRAVIILACLAVLVGLVVLMPATMGLWFERDLLLRNVAWPQRNRLSVEGLRDGHLLAPRGEDLTVSAIADPGFRVPRQVYIQYEDMDESTEGTRGREQMPAVRGQVVRFTHTFSQINESLRCRILGGDAQTDWFIIEVVDRPRVSDVVIRIGPPAYTNLDTYELRAGQTTTRALKGSHIQFAVETNKPVPRAELIRTSHGEETNLGSIRNTGKQRFVGTDILADTSSYHLDLVDGLDLRNRSDRVSPLRFTIGIEPDRPPSVKLKMKGVGEMITRDAVLPIEIDCSDRYGLASVELTYSSTGEKSQTATESLSGFQAGTKTFRQSLEWEVQRRHPAEGDRLTLQARASDFDDIGGPNIGESGRIVFRIVSPEELIAELNRREQEYRQDFERLFRRQEQLHSDLLTLIQPDIETDAEERSRQFLRLARLQRDHAGRIHTLSVQFDQVLGELRINGLATAAAEQRLGGGIIVPMEQLARSQIPAATESLRRLSESETRSDPQEASHQQKALRDEMARILDQMNKWEGFQEAVSLFRNLLQMQRDMSQQTEARIEMDIWGESRSPGPSHTIESDDKTDDR